MNAASWVSLNCGFAVAARNRAASIRVASWGDEGWSRLPFLKLASAVQPMPYDVFMPTDFLFEGSRDKRPLLIVRLRENGKLADVHPMSGNMDHFKKHRGDFRVDKGYDAFPNMSLMRDSFVAGELMTIPTAKLGTYMGHMTGDLLSAFLDHSGHEPPPKNMPPRPAPLMSRGPVRQPPKPPPAVPADIKPYGLVTKDKEMARA
jgi:hypothetical protein